MLLDGVYRLTDGVPIFQPTPAPTTEQLQALLTRIITRLLKMLTRHGALMEEVSQIPYLTNPDADADPALAPLHAAACTYRIALGPRAGQKVLTWKDPAVRLASQEPPQQKGCVSAQGFSLHADTSCASHQRQKLEQLGRYITRPALGHKRLRRTPAGEVVLQLKTPYRKSEAVFDIRILTYYSNSKKNSKCATSPPDIGTLTNELWDRLFAGAIFVGYGSLNNHGEKFRQNEPVGWVADLRADEGRRGTQPFGVG